MGEEGQEGLDFALFEQKNRCSAPPSGRRAAVSKVATRPHLLGERRPEL